MSVWLQTRDEDGIKVAQAVLGSTTIAELRFPPDYAQPRFEPESGYLAFVLNGGLQKTFGRRTVSLGEGTATTIPAAAGHSAAFGPSGAHVLVVKPPAGVGRPYEALLSRVKVRRDPGLKALANRLAAELTALDSAAPVAVEGLALELLAAAVRASPGRLPARRPVWLATVVERLHAEPPGSVSLADLAAAANVDPAHLGRVFRRHYGVSIGTYLRRLRLDWAAATLVGSDMPLARIAFEQGFADQSHFTRAFKRHTGVTPALYRRLARRA